MIIPMEQEEEVILKVSSSKDKGYAKKVAAAMGWRLREVGYCRARAIKEAAVNSAVKAIAITNERVKEAGIKFGVAPVFGKAEATDDPAAVAICMMVEAVNGKPPAKFAECKVSGKKTEGGDHAAATRLATAINGMALGGKGVALKCIGPDAVYRAIMGCVMARSSGYANGMKSEIVPTWETVQAKTGRISLIRIDFWYEKEQG